MIGGGDCRFIRLKIGAACAANGFEAGSNRDASVVLFGFKQAVVRCLEILALGGDEHLPDVSCLLAH